MILDFFLFALSDVCLGKCKYNGAGVTERRWLMTVTAIIGQANYGGLWAVPSVQSSKNIHIIDESSKKIHCYEKHVLRNITTRWHTFDKRQHLWIIQSRSNNETRISRVLFERCDHLWILKLSLPIYTLIMYIIVHRKEHRASSNRLTARLTRWTLKW